MLLGCHLFSARPPKQVYGLWTVVHKACLCKQLIQFGSTAAALATLRLAPCLSDLSSQHFSLLNLPFLNRRDRRSIITVNRTFSGIIIRPGKGGDGREGILSGTAYKHRSALDTFLGRIQNQFGYISESQVVSVVTNKEDPAYAEHSVAPDTRP